MTMSYISTMKRRILSAARRLAALKRKGEAAIVIFEDGHEELLVGTELSVPVPLTGIHGRAKAIVHTHPVPRTAPSLADLYTLIVMARLGVPSYMATVYSTGKTATITIYTATKPLFGLEQTILKKAARYEKLNMETIFDPGISNKQVVEQHAMLAKLGVTVERYRVTLT